MTTRIYLGQLYEQVRREPYVRRDGTRTELIVWRSHCAECGAPFECRTPSEAKRPFSANRRCAEHKRPGTPVRRRRRAA